MATAGNVMAAPLFWPSDPADLFVTIFLWLPPEVFDDWRAERWSQDPWVDEYANKVFDDAFDDGLVNNDIILEVLRGESEEFKGIFTILRGLDEALLYANPFSEVSGVATDLIATLERYRSTGRLNDQTEGWLLPRCSFPGRSARRPNKSESFHVLWVDQKTMDRVDCQRLPRLADPLLTPGQTVQVACVPMADDFADLDLEFFPKYGRHYYLMSAKQDLRARIKSVLETLDSSGAMFGIVPEGTLSGEVLEGWQQAIRTTFPKSSIPLRWILVGTGPIKDAAGCPVGECTPAGNPCANTAFLLDRYSGEVLLTQRKHSPFTLTKEQVSDWGIPRAPGTNTIEEAIVPANTLAIRESSLGRLAVRICEDIYSTTPWSSTALDLGVSHLLVPIFSKPIMKYRWEQQSTERLITEHGAWTVVSNSLIVQRIWEKLPSAPEKRGIKADWYTCIVAGPGKRGGATYEWDIQLGSAPSAVEPARVASKSRKSSLPSVRAGQLE